MLKREKRTYRNGRWWTHGTGEGRQRGDVAVPWRFTPEPTGLPSPARVAGHVVRIYSRGYRVLGRGRIEKREGLKMGLVVHKEKVPMEEFKKMQGGRLSERGTTPRRKSLGDQA